jgi:hypothetical protein
MSTFCEWSTNLTFQHYVVRHYICCSTLHMSFGITYVVWHYICCLTLHMSFDITYVVRHYICRLTLHMLFDITYVVRHYIRCSTWNMLFKITYVVRHYIRCSTRNMLFEITYVVRHYIRCSTLHTSFDITYAVWHHIRCSTWNMLFNIMLFCNFSFDIETYHLKSALFHVCNRTDFHGYPFYIENTFISFFQKSQGILQLWIKHWNDPSQSDNAEKQISYFKSRKVFCNCE